MKRIVAKKGLLAGPARPEMQAFILRLLSKCVEIVHIFNQSQDAVPPALFGLSVVWHGYGLIIFKEFLNIQMEYI